MAEDESYRPPYPAKAAKREVETKEEEPEPIFATHKLNRSGHTPPETGLGQGAGGPPLSSNANPEVAPTQTVAAVINDLAALTEEADDLELAADADSDERHRRDKGESMEKGWAPATSPAPSAQE